jgi:hypothetical protein
MSHDFTTIKKFLLPKENEIDLEYYTLSNDLQIKFKSYYLELKNSFLFKKNISENNLGYLNFIKQRINNWFGNDKKNIIKVFENSREKYENLKYNRKHEYIENNLKNFHPINSFLMHTLIFYINKNTKAVVYFKEISLKNLFVSYSKRKDTLKQRYQAYADAYKVILERVKNNLKCENNFVIDKKKVKFSLDEMIISNKNKNKNDDKKVKNDDKINKNDDKKVNDDKNNKNDTNNDKNNDKNNKIECLDLNKSTIIQDSNKLLPKEFEGMKELFIKEFIYQKNEMNQFFKFYRFYKLFQEYEKLEFNRKLTYNQLSKRENEINIKQNNNVIEKEIKFNFKNIKFI